MRVNDYGACSNFTSEASTFRSVLARLADISTGEWNAGDVGHFLTTTFWEYKGEREDKRRMPVARIPVAVICDVQFHSFMQKALRFSGYREKVPWYWERHGQGAIYV